MAHVNSKVDAYIKHRIGGADPLMAARLAGYAEGAGIKVVASRNEVREDVRKALRAARRAGKVVVANPKPGTHKRLYRSVADEPQVDVNPLEPWKLRETYDSPLDLLVDVMNNSKAPAGLRIQCAKDAMPYCHARKENTKGDEKASKSKAAAEGNFKRQQKPTHLQRVA